MLRWLPLLGLLIGGLLLSLPAFPQQNCPATPTATANNTTCANTAFVQKVVKAIGNIVIGPNSSTVGDIATFSNATGNGIQDSGVSVSSLLTASALRSYLAGLTLSNDATTPNSVLDMAAGVAADSTNAAIISVGAFTKSTAGAWVAGTGHNGMGNGLTIAASTWYHVCLANNAGLPDYWFDTSVACANRPSGISDTKFRRVGSFRTDASAHIMSFFQNGDDFFWLTIQTEVASNTALAADTSAHTLNLSFAPPGVRITCYFTAFISGTTNLGDVLWIAPPDGPVNTYDGTIVNTSSGGNWFQGRVLANASAQLKYGHSISSSGSLWGLLAIGWTDYRGRNN